MIKLPRQIALVLSAFPESSWAPQLVQAINQFALEVVQAFLFTVPKYKVITFATEEDQEDSFPIDFPVDSTPQDVRVAGVIAGDDGFGAITVMWAPIMTPGPTVRIRFITGLSSYTKYSIRLAYQ